MPVCAAAGDTMTATSAAASKRPERTRPSPAAVNRDQKCKNAARKPMSCSATYVPTARAHALASRPTSADKEHDGAKSKSGSNPNPGPMLSLHVGEHEAFSRGR